MAMPEPVKNPPVEQLFDQWIEQAKLIFNAKTIDYGASWRVFRPTSITDQIYIKAKRIRSIEEKGTQKVADPLQGEYLGIINYCIIAQMILKNPLTTIDNWDDLIQVDASQLLSQYDAIVDGVRQILTAKNHDYGEAWRDMRITSYTDLILAKILRIKQIEDHNGTTIASEGVASNYIDIINYCIFALIKLNPLN